MFSIFSNTQKKPTEQLYELQNCAGGNYTRLLLAGPEDESLDMLKPNIIPILKWINERILFELYRVKTFPNAQWIGVRIRIATNMLNKQVEAGNISKEMAITYHERLTSRIRQIVGEIWTEDLPF